VTSKVKKLFKRDDKKRTNVENQKETHVELGKKYEGQKQCHGERRKGQT